VSEKLASPARKEAQQERRRYLAQLYRKGIARGEIFRVMISKFDVTPQTVRSDIRALGLATERFLDNENSLQIEMQSCMDRLLSRSQRDDSVGNRADELIMNVLGMRSAKKYEQGLRVEKARIEKARAELMEAKAELASIETQKAIKSAKTDARLTTEFTQMLNKVKGQRAVSVKDILNLTCLYLEAEIARGPDTDMKQVLSSLRHLTRISLVDPSSAGAEHQLFTLPEGMRYDTIPEPDDGDDLLES